MCDPVTLAVIATTVSAGSAYLQYQGAQQAAVDGQAAANYNFAQKNEALSAERAQLDAQRTEDAVDREIESARASGRIAASINEMGLGPQSGAQLTNVNAFETGRASSISELNFANQREQIQRGVRGAELTRASDMANSRKPSSLSLILGLGEAGVRGGNTYYAAGGT
jgi:hypothetical protein